MTTTPAGKTKATPIVLGVVGVLVAIGLVTNNDDDPPNSSSTPATEEILAEAPQPAPPPADAATGTSAIVPDVVGMNHQLAQDTLQASGFYLLLEEDATGQGRQLVWDRNWEVVSQSVAAGSTATIDTTITLSSKKTGE